VIRQPGGKQACILQSAAFYRALPAGSIDLGTGLQCDEDISALERAWRSVIDTPAENREYAGHNLFEICRASITRRLKVNPTAVQHGRGDVLIQQCIDEYTRDAILTLLFFRRIFQQWHPDVILHFSGRFHRDRCTVLVAEELGIPIVAIESSFHDRYLYWDHSGRTGASGQMGRAGQVVLSPDLEARVNMLMAESLRCPVTKGGEQTNRAQNKGSLRKRIILFLGQVPYDASIVEEGGDFSNQVETVKMLSTLLIPTAHQLIVRPHPKAPEIGLAIRDTRLPDVWVVEPSESAQLFDMLVSADCVVTVCSQAGLQAAWLGKPVVLLGKAFYADKGFTFDGLGKIQSATKALSLALDSPNRDSERRQSYYRYLAYLSESCMLRTDDWARAADLLTTTCKRRYV
jgi:hypothetical protein